MLLRGMECSERGGGGGGGDPVFKGFNENLRLTSLSLLVALMIRILAGVVMPKYVSRVYN